MNHQRFCGSNIKRTQNQSYQQKEIENVSNNLFANIHLKNIKLPKQLTQQFCFDLDYGLVGMKLETKSPSKQTTYHDSTKLKFQISPKKQDYLRFQLNIQETDQPLSEVIKIRRCQPDKILLNQKQQNLNPLQSLNLKRKRAGSFAEEKSFSPDPKYKRSRLNSIVFRNFQNHSLRLEENQLEN